MRRVDWSRQAQCELDELLAFYAQFGADVPARLVEQIDLATARLLDHPRLGPELADSHIRKWVASGTPFLLFYRPVGDGIRVLKVLDARSDWKDR